MSGTGRRTRDGGANFRMVDPVSEELFGLGVNLRELADKLPQELRVTANRISTRLFVLADQTDGLDSGPLVRCLAGGKARAGA